MPNRFLFVDVNNVAHECHLGVSYRFVREAIQELAKRLRDVTPHYVADYGFRALIRRDERDEFDEACERHQMTVAARGVPADNVILPEAHETNGLVVSNDHFREFHRLYPWIGHPRRLISVMCLGGFQPRYFWRHLNRRHGDRADPNAEILPRE